MVGNHQSCRLAAPLARSPLVREAARSSYQRFLVTDWFYVEIMDDALQPPPMVVDANVLIDDVLQGMVRGRATALRRVLASNHVMVCTHETVIDEVRRHLPGQARRRGLDPQAALSILGGPTRQISTGWKPNGI